jgi:RNA polymerase sigma-70 factor (ECF subfamily)
MGDLNISGAPVYIMQDESIMLSLLKTGDSKAFEQLYDLYSERIYLNLLKLVKSESIAEELLQDIFVKLWEKRAIIDVKTTFRAYLFRVMENRVHDFFRKTKLDKRLHNHIISIASEKYTHIEEAVFNREASGILWQALDTLPPRRKEIFRLCKIEGKSYEEVSRELHISPSTISDHIVKATKAIREFFDENRELALSLLIYTSLAGLK